MARRINQPTANPTNKLSAAVITSAGMSVAGLLTRNFYPEWYDPEVWATMMPIMVFAAGYVVKDAPNVET